MSSHIPKMTSLQAAALRPLAKGELLVEPPHNGHKTFLGGRATMHRSTFIALIRKGWLAPRSRDWDAPFVITDAGRTALREYDSPSSWEYELLLELDERGELIRRYPLVPVPTVREGLRYELSTAGKNVPVRLFRKLVRKGWIELSSNVFIETWQVSELGEDIIRRVSLGELDVR